MKSAFIITCLVILGLISHVPDVGDVSGREPRPPFKAGAAKIDITPDFAVPLAGFGVRARSRNPSEGIHDPIYARAIVMDDGNRRVAICNVDLVIVTDRLRKAVWQRLKGTGLDGLLLFATHNHSGMGGYVDNLLAEMVAMGPYDEKAFYMLADKVSRTIRGASNSLKPAQIGWKSVLTRNLSRNRRVQGGVVDPEIGVVRIQDEDEKPVAMIVSFAAHPTVLDGKNMLISGDFPGYLARFLEEREGGVVLFANGASADIGPKITGKGDRFIRAKDLGEALGRSAIHALGKIETKRHPQIAVFEKELRLPSRPDLKPVFRIPLLTRGVSMLVDIWLPEKTTLQVISIGDLLLIGVPCELGAAVGLELKGAVIPGKAYIISLANDYIGYVVTRELYRMGVYEAKASFYGPGLVELLKDEVLGMIETGRKQQASGKKSTFLSRSADSGGSR